MTDAFDQLQKLGQSSLDTTLRFYGEWAKGWQTLATEFGSFQQRSLEEGSQVLGQLASASAGQPSSSSAASRQPPAAIWLKATRRPASRSLSAGGGAAAVANAAGLSWTLPAPYVPAELIPTRSNTVARPS